MKLLLYKLIRSSPSQQILLKTANASCLSNKINSISTSRRHLNYLNIGGRINSSTSSSVTATPTLLLSPAEATRILRTNESTVDLESKCSIKYYDVNYLGANNPSEDRQAQAKYLNSDIYLFGVFDGHGGYFPVYFNVKLDRKVVLFYCQFAFSS